MNPCIAIIERNTLCSMSLRNMLWELYNNVEVHCYRSMDSFIRDSNRHFIHFFVSSEILFCHIDEFETLKSQTTILSPGLNRSFREAGYNILDVSLPEAEIMDRLTGLQFISRHESLPAKKCGDILSAREKDVLRLMIKGMINKEIAKELDISLNTVIFHRNNICTKLNTRSLGRMTIFAVLSGMIDINEI